MSNLTRRNLLKTGVAASTGFIVAGSGIAGHTPEAEALAVQAHAAPRRTAPDLRAQASPREKVLLDFGWRFHLGDANDAMKDFRWGAPVREGTFAKAGQDWIHNPKDGSLQHSFDDSAWRVVDLPHDWAVELPFVSVPENDVTINAAHGGKPIGRQFPATSIGWYNRTFDVPQTDLGKRITIEFDGVFRDAMVLFNGFYLGKNMSGYAPFSFDITDYVKYGGSNVITVRADATLNESWYYEGAGIYRHTWLTKTDPLHIAQSGTAVRSEVRGKGARIAIETEILNDSDDKRSGIVTSKIFDPTGKLVATVAPKPFEIPAHESVTVETQTLLTQASLWSLEQPNLYRVVSHIESHGAVTDHADTIFGIRTIRFDANQGFFLNGKPVKINGTCNHQDHAGVGIAVPDSIHADRVAAMKSMGSNGWRTAHNIVAPEFLDACDRQGMMVMAETRMMASTPEGLSELERMVKRDRNHPCIVIWSLANEEYFYQGTPTGARIVTTMKRLVKKLDPTRVVTAAMNGGWVHGGVSDVVDVQGFNYWNGNLPDTRSNKPKGAPVTYDIDAFHRDFPNKPCIGTEVSNAGSSRGIYVTDPAQGHLALYKAGMVDENVSAETVVAAYNARPFLSGSFNWTGIDYRGEPNPFDRVCISSQFGCVDTCLYPKDIFFYYKSWWGTEPVLHLFPHWNWHGKEGSTIEVRCFSNTDGVELFVNGESQGAKPMPRDGHLTWSVKYAPGAIEARGSNGGKVVLTERRETTGAAAKLVLRANRAKLNADRMDTSAVTVEIQDADGRLMPTASHKIEFKLTGPGKIIGVGNGDPACHEADRPDAPNAAMRSAFNGLCLALVQSNAEAGTIHLEASAQGLTSATVEIETAAPTT
ncbi:MAG TPA: beta-galactosidase GalA [Acidobacteriaceae bacterium]|nr:beta-galactosidase GalA [Acidobacteriaceae bacterium]